MFARMQPLKSLIPLEGEHSVDSRARDVNSEVLRSVVTTMEMTRPHIALVGFMGAGKSSVGRALADRLGLEFVDLDQEIEEIAGKSIPEIFKDSGEVAFRAKERAALRDILKRSSPIVLATGGGTFTDKIMRELISKNARTIYLQTEIATIMERVGIGEQRDNRPLLRGPSPEKTIELLLQKRQPDYESAEFTVETSHSPIDDVVHRILETMGLHRSPRQQVRAAERGQTIGMAAQKPALPPIESTPDGLMLTVQSSNGPYSVQFREHAGDWIAEEIAGLIQSKRVAVITDSTVSEIHAKPLLADLKKVGISAELLQFDAGEPSKTLGTAARLFDQLLEIGLSRNDTLIALGGGVVGDMTGFVASTFLRGIDFIQVPTTTLAAVDSSVGGKTAVNTPRGKNLVGTFHAPNGVFIAVSHLATQQRAQHGAGLVEALKMAATLDAPLFNTISEQAESLLDYDAQKLLPILAKSIQLKAFVVEQDEREEGIRAVLNYGHTIGHAIEKGEDFEILHGHAVALGMIAESEWGQANGGALGLASTLGDALKQLEIPIEWTQSKIDSDSLNLDKKRTGSGTSVKIPIIPNLGQFEMKTVPISSLRDFVKGRTSS